MRVSSQVGRSSLLGWEEEANTSLGGGDSGVEFQGTLYPFASLHTPMYHYITPGQGGYCHPS